jgi:pilus assembly protein Flp/PilA
MDDSGQDLIEYALLASFVALVAIAGATFLGTALQNWYTTAGSRVNSAAAGS